MAEPYRGKIKLDNIIILGGTTMTQEITRIKLTAADGMVLTDGELYGREIYLSADADPVS